MKALIALLFLIALSISATAGAQEPDPKPYVETAAAELFALPGDGASLAVLSHGVTDFLDTHVDMAGLSRGVSGNYRNQLSPEQTRRFESVFHDSLKNLLVKALKDTTDPVVTVSAVKQPRPDRAQVQAIVLLNGGKSRYETSFSLAAMNDEWRVRNLIINGVNLGLTFRNQFSELARSYEKDFDAVIAAWVDVVNETGADASPQAGGANS